MSADEFKAKGNAAFQKGQFEEAINWFTNAIQIDPNNHVLYSNRSAAYCSKGEAFDLALKDALKTVELQPNWAKGYTRVGAAYHGKKNYQKAIEAYKKGLELDPGNEACLKGIEDCGGNTGSRPAGGAGGANPFAQIFGPDVWTKIALNPKLKPYLDQPDYVNMIKMVQANPQMMNSFLQDKRIMQTFAALAGLNMELAGADEGEMEQDEPPKPTPKPAPKPAQPAPSPAATPEEQAANEAKERGNAHYKKKEFEQALECYDKAIELCPNNILYLLNKAAVFIEQSRFEDAVQICDEAINKGQELKADLHTLAKAYARKAAAQHKLKDYNGAIATYKSSLLNHRTAEVLTKLNAVEKEKKEAEELAYYSLEKAQEAKELGNEHFKNQRFPDAIRAYDEAIKRNPKDATFYCNRAAAYIKLQELAHAMSDCDKSLELDPTYVKAIVRKAHIFFWRKEYHKALTWYESGLKLAPDNEELRSGLERTHQQIMAAQQSGDVDQDRVRKAMADPEIQNILQDPVMQSVLRDFSENPAAAQAHLKDPSVMSRLQKLIAAGVVSTKSR